MKLNLLRFLKKLVYVIILMISWSCAKKLLLLKQWDTLHYEIVASDRKKVKGFLYKKESNLKSKFFRKTENFNASELLQIRSVISAEYPTDKMLISDLLVNDSSKVGLYEITIVNAVSTQNQDHLNDDNTRMMKKTSIYVHVLKFKDRLVVNLCRKCDDLGLASIKEAESNFQQLYANYFTEEEMMRIVKNFNRGPGVYSGHGRYR